MNGVEVLGHVDQQPCLPRIRELTSTPPRTSPQSRLAQLSAHTFLQRRRDHDAANADQKAHQPQEPRQRGQWQWRYFRGSTRAIRRWKLWGRAGFACIHVSQESENACEEVEPGT